MKRLVAILLSLVMAGSLVACEKQPVEKISATQAAVDVAASEGSEKYAAEDFSKVNEAMAAAMEEVKAQDSKMFKNYGKANQMLEQVKADAEALKVKATAEKERMKIQAMTDLTAAQQSYTEAKGLVANAPMGKGSAADIMAMQADVAGLETALQEVQPMIDAGDYPAASGKALAITEKAVALSAEIRTAMEKMAIVAQEAKAAEEAKAKAAAAAATKKKKK